MEFSYFAQALEPVIRTDAIPIYTRTLFEVTLPEKENFRLENFSLTCFKNYYYGYSKIDKLKKTIGKYMNFNLFENYIQGHSSSVRQALCNSFSNATPESIGTYTAYIFSQIMSDDTWGGKLSGKV